MKQKHFIVAFLAMLMCFASPTFAQVAKIGDVEYATLTEAITNATAGQTITLIADVTENVTISKDVTIDGAGKTYTGAMSLKNGAITIKKLNFDGKGYNGYAIAGAGANYLTIENCTAKNYGYGFVQVASGTVLTTVKNVTVSDMNYGVKVDYSNAVVIENANITAGVAAVLNSNYGGKTITIKDSNLSILGTYVRNNTTKTNYVFDGENSIDKFIIEAAIDNFKLAAGATLTAPNAITVTTEADYEVKYENGKYTSVALPKAVMIGEQGYETIADAVAAATAGQTITLTADVTENVTISKAVTIEGAGNTYTGAMEVKADATFKNMNFDGKGYNGYAITTRGANYLTIEGCTAKNYGYGFVQLASATALTTVKDVTVSNMNYGVKVDYSGAVVIENADITAGVAAVLNSNYGEKTITINNSKLNILGTWTRNNTIKTNYVFEGNNTIDSFIIEAAIDNFQLAAGATLTAPNEIAVTTVEEYEVEYKDGKYASVEAAKAAKIGDTKYKTFDEAYKAASKGTVIELLQTAVLTANKNYTKAVTVNANFGATAFRVQNDATVTFGGLTINSNDYCFILGAKDASSAGNLKIQSGTYNGVVTAVSVTKGELTIAGRGNTVPTFKVEPYEGSYDYTINCIDANYKSGDAKVAISNGKFYNFDPANNAAEGKGTNFLKANTAVATVKGEDGYYACVKAVAQVNDKYYATFDEAVAAAKPGDTLKLLEDATITKTINAAGLTIEGKGTNDPSTLTYTGSGASARAITVESGANGANLTIKNLIVDCTASYCQRGINYNTTGALTLDNVTVKGKNVTYALNLPGSSVGANVTINKSSLTGNIALNVWGKNAEINATDSHFTSVDNSTVEGYSAIVLNNDGTTAAERAIVNINGGYIIAKDEKGEPSYAVRNATATGKVNVSVSDITTVVGEISNPVAIVTYGSDQFYSCATLQAAIDKAIETKGAVKLIADVTASEIIVVNAPVVIDGNGKTLTSTAARAINVVTEGEVTIKNLVVKASGERAFNVITKPGTLNIKDVTATAANYTVNVATSAGAAKVNVSNSTLTGLNVVNVAAPGAYVKVEGGTIVCNDQTDTESYSALALNKAAVGAKIETTDVTFDIKGDSKKASNGAVDGVISIDGNTNAATVDVAYIQYGNYYNGYTSLAAAVAAAKDGETIGLIRDVTGAGVVIDKDITIDFNGKTYTVNKTVGSTGTTTLGLQILKENNVVLKNGTLKSTAVTEGKEVKMLVQNYANLTVENMNLVDETEHILYVLSNNSGNVVVKGNTNITTDAVAFDACKYANYAIPTVTVKEGVVVKGDVEVSAILNMNATLEGSILLNATTGVVNTTKEYNVTTDVANSKVVLNNGAYTVVAVNYVAKVGEQGYETLTAALAAAPAGQTITLAADVTEDVTISKAVTIDGVGKTYTGAMTLKADATINNVNFDGKGYNGYAITTRGANYLTIEDCTAENYGYGFVQLASATALTTVKNVTVSNMNYGVKVDYSGAVAIENADITAGVAAVLNSNYGEKTITIKNSELNILGTWTRNKTTKTNYVFEGENSIDKFIIDAAIDNFQLAAGATLTAPNEITVTTVENYVVEYNNGTFTSVKAVAEVAGVKYSSLAAAVEAAPAGETVKIIATAATVEGAGVVIDKDITIDFNGKTYTVNKTVGSTGTTTLGLQILKDNNVVLKNGTLKSTAVTEGKEVKMLVQNYANLTVENMILVDETEHILYVLSNNSGNVVVKGNTNITTDAVAFDACKYANYAIPTVTVETTGKIAGAIEVTGGNLAIKGGTYTTPIEAAWCAAGFVPKANADGTYGVSYNPLINNVAKVGENYYPTLRAAVDAAPAGATVELIKDVVLEGGYADDPDAGLRIEKAITIRGKHTIDCGNFTKGIRVYNNSGNKSIVSFYNLTIVNNNAYGRCIDTRSGNIDLLLYVTNLKATGTNSQPLTLGGNERLYRARIQGSTIDAGTTGYGVICFVPSWGGITASTGSKIKGYAAFYIKDGVNNTNIKLDKGTYTGINTFNQGSGVFGAVVVEGDNNTISVVDPNTVVYAVSGNGADKAHQAAFFVAEGATGNTIKITNANVTTNGDCTHFAMVHTDVANSTSLVKDGVNMQLVAECNGYQFVTLEEAFNFAVNNSTVKLLADVTLDTKNVVTECDGYASIINVEGKAVTFDLNGKAMTVNAYAADLADAKNSMLLAVFSTDEGGNLTLTDSSEDKTGSVTVNAGDAKVYSLVANYTNGCYVTINGGNYYADKLYDSMIYTGANEAVVVNGGKFILGNVGTGANGKPWIFNALGGNERHVTVNGGTFNADVLHQYWVFEVNAPKESALRQNEDGTWTMVDAVAYVTEKHGKYNNYVGYATIEEAIARNNKVDNTVTMVKDVEISKMITVSKDETLVLNLNGMTIAAIDNTTKNYSAIDNRGNLTITGEGKITVKANVNSGWNRYSAVIANNPGGNLTVENGTIEHLGGTDMAYGIDNLTNGKGTYAETTINGGLIKSTYRAVRQFLNGVEAQNILTVNGGTLEGANKSIFFHDPSKNANSGTLYVADDARLNGDVYLFVTAGSTEWPVEVEIAKEALGTSQVLSANVPEKNAVLVEYDTYWTVEQKNVAEMIIEDDCEEYINVVEKTVGTLTYKRYFENTEWQTIYLPFAVPFANLKDEFEVAYIYNAAYKNGSATIDYVVVEDENFVLAANYPYLIRAKEAGNNEIVVENAKLMPTAVETIDCSSVFETFSFIGSYSSVAECDAAKRYFVLNDGAWVSMSEANPFRFYLQIEKRDGSSFAETQGIRMRSVDMNGIENATGVESVDAEQNVDYIFDVHGRRVVEPQKGGIYIINGVKVIF